MGLEDRRLSKTVAASVAMVHSILASLQILSLPSTDENTAVEQTTTLTFLDEFRMVFLTPKTTSDVLGFTLFDTFVPRGRPVNSWRFCIPLRSHGWFPSIYVDNGRCLGTPDQDGSLTTDPTQAVFVVKQVSRNGPPFLLIMRIQTLIDHARSTSTDTCVPWDVWGKDTLVMGVPIRSIAHGGLHPLVQGVHVILVGMDNTGSCLHPILHTFDLSWRGRSVLPHRDGGVGTERRISFEDERRFSLQGEEGMIEWGFDSLGDGRFMYLVSCFRFWKSGGRLTLWKEWFFWFGGRVACLGTDLSGSIVQARIAGTGFVQQVHDYLVLLAL